MKKIIYILALAIGFSATASSWAKSEKTTLTVASYNLRNANAHDSVNNNGWGQRVPYIAQMMMFEQPAIFGTQECKYQQLLDLKALMPGYDCIGGGRDDGKRKGEHSAIFYNTNRMRLLHNGDFWLAEDPTRPVKGWDASLVRICSWGEFKDLVTGKKVFFFNLHMDHRGIVARRESAKLVMQKIREIAGSNAAILTGDFNVDQTNEIYSIFTSGGLLRDAYQAAKLRFAANGTFNSFTPELHTDSRIDHIFLTSQYNVEAYAVLTNSYWVPADKPQDKVKGKDAPNEISFQKYIQRTISDHYPIFARLTLK